MDNNDPTYGRRPRLVFDRTQFDDYWIALLASIRQNVHADRIISGAANNPLVVYQQNNSASLTALGVPFLTDQQIVEDPAGTYDFFCRRLATALASAGDPVPDVTDLHELQQLQNDFMIGERHIYNTVVATLQVGISMHYARQVAYGAGMACWHRAN